MANTECLIETKKLKPCETVYLKLVDYYKKAMGNMEGFEIINQFLDKTKLQMFIFQAEVLVQIRLSK